MTAVSYTHLDVYKRQQIDEMRKSLPEGTEFVTMMSSNDFLFASIHNVVEDVYKRQITRSEAVSFVIGGRGFVATGIRNSTSLSSDYWLYDPDTVSYTHLPGHGKTTSKVEYAMVPWLSV